MKVINNQSSTLSTSQKRATYCHKPDQPAFAGKCFFDNLKETDNDTDNYQIENYYVNGDQIWPRETLICDMYYDQSKS